MIRVRPFAQQDFIHVKDIYQQGIDTGDATFQETAKEWLEWDAAMLESCRLVALDGRIIVGWAALSPVSNRAVYSGVAEVSIYISDQARARGVGHKLLSHLITASEANNIWTLQAGIFPENGASISLHKNNGFRVLGIREKVGKMNHVWRDSVLMERRSQIVGFDNVG